MVTLKINQKEICVVEGTTIMEAAKLAGIQIPHLCYLKDLNEIGACRVCVVEMVGAAKLITACNTVVQEGMEIKTNSAMVRDTRRTNVQLILSQHDCECAHCVRSGNCSLQTIANDLNMLNLPFEKNVKYSPWNTYFPLIRESNKCIKCMRCIQVCDKIQDLQIWDLAGTGARTTVNVSLNRRIEDADCSLCGQCITHCPVGALHERDDTLKVFQALNDPDKICIVQVAPAVRVAWAEELGLSKEDSSIEKVAASLRALGFDYVFDTDFGADLTIMEESSELLKRLEENHGDHLPMFTSCCPGWIRYIKSQYPEMVSHLSTSKSPHQMAGAIIKTYFAKKLNVDPCKLFVVSIMPCVAKKSEIDLPTMDDAGTGKDVNVVLTTREFIRMLRADYIDVSALDNEALDSPLGIASGAGVIFGATGGVMEAALRTAYYFVQKENAPMDAFEEVRGMKGWKEANFTIGETTLHTAVVNGLGNARKLMEAIKHKEVAYDFIEVMACPGGCVGGGGQPIHDGEELAECRSHIIYDLDKAAALRHSHENPAIIQLYKEYLDKPLSTLAEDLLHTDHNAWDMPCSQDCIQFDHNLI